MNFNIIFVCMGVKFDPFQIEGVFEQDAEGEIVWA